MPWGRVVVFGLVGLGHRQPFSLNGLVLGCIVLIFLGPGNRSVDRSRLCRMLVIVPVELVDIAAARLVLLVCIDTCKVCLLFCFALFFCLCYYGFLEAPDRKQMFRTVLA